MKKLFATVLVALTVACASLPVKQQAAVSLQSVLLATETARNFERAVCQPTASLDAVVKSCTAQAHQLGLSDEKHRNVSNLFGTAFNQIADAADGFAQWTPIEARPKLSQIVSTLHLVKVELTPLAGLSSEVAAIIAAVDKALALIEKVQGLK